MIQSTLLYYQRPLRVAIDVNFTYVNIANGSLTNKISSSRNVDNNVN